MGLNDFIVLDCPKCGGQLKLLPSTLSLKCTNCGTELIVRQDVNGIVLEIYARCPVCNRNDKVEKITAIVSSQTNSMNGVTIEKNEYRDKDGRWYTSSEKVPFTGSQSTVLAAKFKPTPKTHNII